jgi:hypothetical protein
MANDSKLGNLLKFTEYDHLQPKQKPTKYTEIGGFTILEGLSVKELLKLAAEKTGKSKKELKKLTPKKLKKLCGEQCEDKEEKDEKKDEGVVNEASAKQKAARKKFMEMIAKKKGLKEGDEKRNNKDIKDGDKKKAGPPSPVKKKNESLVLEASAKQKAARKKFMEMIASKKKVKKDKECKDDKNCK